MKRLVLFGLLLFLAVAVYSQMKLSVRTICPKVVELKWKVKFEDHIDRYVVEWSKDGIAYDSVAVVYGEIWNPTPSVYVWYDNVEHIKITETHYYRVKTVWLDGGYAWCKPVRAVCKRKR